MIQKYMYMYSVRGQHYQKQCDNNDVYRPFAMGVTNYGVSHVIPEGGHIEWQKIIQYCLVGCFAILSSRWERIVAQLGV